MTHPQRHRHSLRPKLLVTTLAAATLLTSHNATAQTTEAPATSARSSEPALRYDLVPGPLGQTLITIGQRSGRTLSLDPALVAGRQAPAVRGDFTAAQAAQIALTGSGLVLTRNANGVWVLRKAPQSTPAEASPQDQTLATVTVSAQAATNAITEGSSNYGARASTVGKAPLAHREIPQSVTVVTRQQLDDQNITSVEEALKNVTGVTVQRFDAAGHYSIFNARGYGSDTYQIDGVTLQTDANGIYLDLAAFDRVEVLRGAAGMFSGAGEPGVTVNLARKRALAPFHAKAATTIGSWNNVRADLDVTGALTESGRVRGRLVAAVQDHDSYMEHVDGSKKMVYGTVEADLTDHTTVSVGAAWQDVGSVLSRGLPTWADGSLIDLPRSVMPVQQWNRQQMETHDYFAELEHHTDDDALLKLTLRHTERSNKGKFTDPSPPDASGWMTALTSAGFIRKDADTTADLYFNTPLTWGGRTHNLLVGADWRTTDNNTNYSDYSIRALEPVNLFEPNPYAIPEPVFDYNTNVSRTQVRSRGIYGQARYKASNALTLIGGGRVSWWQSDGVSNRNPSGFEARSEFTPYAGAIYELTRQLSLYTSYSQIFKAQNNLTVQGDQIKPRTGTQVEVGLKGEAKGGKIQYAAALYRIGDESRALSDPANVGFYLPSGKARSQGMEVEVRGQLTRQWNLAAGYAYTTTKYLRGTAAQQDQPYSTFTPRHNLNFWANYEVPHSLLPGLEVGAGVRIVSDFYNQSGSTTVRAPGYGVAALRLGYRISDRYKVALNIDNLFDKVYWEKVSYPGRQNFYGAPRSVTLTLRGHF